MEKFCSSKTLLKMAGGEVHAYFFRYSFYAVGDTFFSAYNPKNLPTTSLFEGILHKLSFGAVFMSGSLQYVWT